MTTGLHRRQLLRLSALALAAVRLAPWIDEAFAQEERADANAPRREPKPSSPRARALSQAWIEARKRGKPMLVFVVPLAHDQHERGALLAEYLRTASDEAHADLALCEVACATVAELRALVPGIAARFDGEPLAVLVELDGKAARAVLGQIPRLPKVVDIWRPDELTAAEIDERERWVDSIAKEFHAAIAPDPGALERRAHQALESLSPTDREQLVALELGGSRSSARCISLCPPWALFAATTADARGECIAELSRLSRAAVVERSPRGARWAERLGACGGMKLEDPQEVLSGPGPCGTGFLPAKSRRFLCLYSKSDL